MTYTVFVERYAQKQIMKLDKKAVPVIKAALPDWPTIHSQRAISN